MKLTKNFKEHEFTCKCGCNFNEVDTAIVEKLQTLRNWCGFPLKINSCCRCKIRNREEQGSETSEHLTCDGFDIEILDSNRRFSLVYHAMQLNFKRIGVYKDFIHLGVSKTHPQNVLWHG